MSLIDHRAPPTPSMLRWFGLSFAILFLFIAYGLSHVSSALAIAVALAGVGFGAVYYLLPSTKIKIIRAWQVVTAPVAWLMGHLLLGSVYFLVFCPIGIALRLLGYDPLEMKKGEIRSSAWKKKGSSKVDRYFKQF